MDKYKKGSACASWRNFGDTPKRVSPYVQDPHLDPNLESILLSLLWIPSESRVVITPHPLIGFASEYMHWKALLRGFPLDGVSSTTTHDTSWYAAQYCHRCGFTDPNMTGTNRHVRQELAGSGNGALTGTGARWCVRWEAVLSVTSLRQEQCSRWSSQ
jgi:hypothetical protein